MKTLPCLPGIVDNVWISRLLEWHDDSDCCRMLLSFYRATTFRKENLVRVVFLAFGFYSVVGCHTFNLNRDVCGYCFIMEIIHSV